MPSPRNFIPVLAALATLLLAPASFAAKDPAFVPSRNSPIQTAGTPIGVAPYDQASSESGLLVLNRRPAGIQVFENRQETPLLPVHRFRVKEDPLSLQTFTDTWSEVDAVGVVRHDGDFSFYRVTHSSSKGYGLVSGNIGVDIGPVTALAKYHGLGIDSAPFGRVKVVAVDTADDSLILVSQVPGFPDAIEATVPVGDQPVDIYSENAIAMFVVNRGSDDISVVRYFQDPDETGEIGQGNYGHWEVTDTAPVGESPVAIAAIPSRQGRNLFAVANSGSDDVSILRLNPDSSMDELGRVPVGDRPVALTSVQMTANGRWRLAVANAGSDDVTIIEGEFNGTFAATDTIPVGSNPVSITSGDFDEYFDADLAVADRASGQVSVLLDNEPSGTCRGGAAKLLRGGQYSDSLFGTHNPDQILGLTGDDEIHGGKDGFDCLFGGKGKDSLDGYKLGDLLDGGPDADTLTGGTGTDLVIGGAGDDFLCENLEEEMKQDACGVPYRDYSSWGRIGRPERDRLFGGPGNDRIQADYGRDLVSGGSGRDDIFSRDGARDLVTCGAGRDRALVDDRDRVRGCETVKRIEVSRES